MSWRAAYADPNNNEIAKLLEASRWKGSRAQRPSRPSPTPTAATGSPGCRATTRPSTYVVERLEAAGYDPVVQPFDYLAFDELGPSALQQMAPNAVTYVEDVDFGVVTQSDPGDVTAAVTAVDLQLGLGNTSTSGCEAADFAGFPAGNIALLQRGTCTFELKAENAAAAGAVGDRHLQPGQHDRARPPGHPGRHADRQQHQRHPGDRHHLRARRDARRLTRRACGCGVVRQHHRARSRPTVQRPRRDAGGQRPTTSSWSAPTSTPCSRARASTTTAPARAAILEVAEQMAQGQARATRCASPGGAPRSPAWSARPFYVDSSRRRRSADDIALYLNFDMVGSPNYVRFVYDGDGGDIGAGRAGRLGRHRGGVRRLLRRPRPGLPSRRAFDGRSDYGPFIADVGIPAGGLFTGAEGIKTAEQAAIYGGTAGAAVRPVLPPGLRHVRQRSTRGAGPERDAIAHATMTFAQTRRS